MDIHELGSEAVSDLGVGGRSFGQIPGHRGSTGDKGGLLVVGAGLYQRPDHPPHAEPPLLPCGNTQASEGAPPFDALSRRADPSTTDHCATR